MKILLVNDDGYQSRGIQLLKQEISKKHEVFLCAPLKQMSASSHAITLFKPMKIVKAGLDEYAVDGTPADCVKVSLFYLFQNVQFDLLISGINDGPNMGDDIFYSGTVAAAREGSMNDLFSIATSLDGWDENRYFDHYAKFVAALVDNLTPEILQEKIVLNINFPNEPYPKGVRMTHLGERVYRDFITNESKDGQDFVTIGGENPGFSSLEGSDLNAVSEGYISMTPLINEASDPVLLKKMKFLEKTKIV